VMVKVVYWIAVKVWKLFTFTLYIRTILQVSQLYIIVAVSEIYHRDLSSVAMIFSFVFAFITLCVIIGFSSLNTILVFNTSEKTNSVFEEYFIGIKKTKIARMYNVVIMARRLILVSCMVCLSSIDKVYLVFISVCYQVAHTIFIGWMRPYESIKDNINEIMIDVVFSILLITLLYFNTEDTWNGIVTSAYFYLLNFPGLFIFFSSLGRCCQE